MWCWHHTGDAVLELPLDSEEFSVVEDLWEAPMELISPEAGLTKLPVGKRRYIRSGLPMEVLKEAVQKAKRI